MAEYNSVNLGRIMPKYTGDYSTTVNYNTLDIVFYEGSSYIATQPSLRQTPTIDSEYWGLISGKGDKGDKGDTGATGPKGDKGDKGDPGKDGYMPVIGGRNLLLGTADWSGGSTIWNPRFASKEGTYSGLLIYASSSAWTSPMYLVQNAGILQVGKTYTFSTYVRNTSDTDTKISYYYDRATVTPPDISIPLLAHTDWTRVSATFNVIKDPATTPYGLRWESKNSVTNGQIQFAGYKLEEGNIPTDWSPAPEDVPSNDSQLVHKTGNETVAGDKTFTGSTTLATTTILAGTYGLRVTSSGFQKTTDGKTWVSANI